MYNTKQLIKDGLINTNLWSLDDVTEEYGAYAVSDFLENCIKTYDNYLVFAFDCTWNGSNGYTFKQDIFDCVVRSYDCSQYVWAISKNNKAILLKEFHHDKPYGHSTVVIGLTDKEYEALVNKDFSEIEKFALKHYKSLDRSFCENMTKYA